MEHPDLTLILSMGAVIAVATYAILEVTKMFFRSWKRRFDGRTPWYYAASIRAAALCLGSGMGTAMYASSEGVDSGWPWGTLIGLGAGSLCTVIVATVKAQIKSKGEA